MTTGISQQLVAKVADQAKIQVSSKQAQQLAKDFESTLDVISNLQSVETGQVEPTHQVTGLENILREDKVDTNREFSQAEALANAPRSYRGYFIVDRVIEDQE